LSKGSIVPIHKTQNLTRKSAIGNTSFILGITVLGLAQIELNFYIVACTVLCFGVVTKTVLITKGCFSSCWAVLTQS